MRISRTTNIKVPKSRVLGGFKLKARIGGFKLLRLG